MKRYVVIPIQIQVLCLYKGDKVYTALLLRYSISLQRCIARQALIWDMMLNMYPKSVCLNVP